MELWQLGLLGNVSLNNGIGVSVVTGIDDHSRFCVIAKVVARATARPVCEALIEALNTYGVPEQILTDSSKVFTGRLGTRPPTCYLTASVSTTGSATSSLSSSGFVTS